MMITDMADQKSRALGRTVYHFNDYKDYIRDRIEHYPGGSRGQRKAIATCIGTESTFVSQVLNGRLNLSAEQAQALGAYFLHSEGEALYFLKLVQIARAGTKELRNLLAREAEAVAAQELRSAERSAAADDPVRYLERLEGVWETDASESELYIFYQRMSISVINPLGISWVQRSAKTTFDWKFYYRELALQKSLMDSDTASYLQVDFASGAVLLDLMRVLKTWQGTRFDAVGQVAVRLELLDERTLQASAEIFLREAADNRWRREVKVTYKRKSKGK